MKKTIFSILSFVLVAVAVVSLSSCSFTGLSPEEVKNNLEAAGYKVQIIDGSTYSESDDNIFGLSGLELSTYLYAFKGEDEIYMFYFYTIDEASFESDFIHIKTYGSNQTNHILYYGTRQAIRDSKM